MNRLLVRMAVTGSFSLLLAWQAWGQGKSAPSSPPPSQPSSGANTRGNNGQTVDPNRGTQTPLYVEGQIIDENGHPSTDRLSVKLSCGMRTLQTIKTDINGYFRFALGLDNQANADFGAADESSPSSSSSNVGGLNMPGGMGGFGSSGFSLTGCDVRVSAAGYAPLESPVSDTPSLGTIDIGVLQLQRVGTAPTGSVSATSLLVPSNARKEYEQGVKELQSNHLPQATQHLEKAVGVYDKYAAAWAELGRVYAASHEMDKAQQSFQKSIAADPKYAPPYVSLGAIQLQNQDYEAAAESIGKAVEVDPAITVGIAGYIQGVADFQMQRLDAAQQSLLQAEKAPHANTPQLHVILAEIYLEKDDSSTAASHMRAYVKEAPQGSFAAQMRERLQEIDQAASNNAGGAGAPPTVAP